MINRRSRLTTFVPNNLWDVKEPTHCSKRLGDVVLSVGLSLSLISSVLYIHAWVGWVDEIEIWTGSCCQWRR